MYRSIHENDSARRSPDPGRMTPEQARIRLAEWRQNHDQRDPLVLTALAAGLEKMEIHQITGLSRATIDRIERGQVDPEDLRKYNAAAIRLANDLAPGESARWADLVNTAASMAKVDQEGQPPKPATEGEQ